MSLADVGLEIVPVGKIDLGRRHDQAVDQRVALGVENPGRFHLRQRSDQLLQPQMQHLLARNDVGIGNVADDLGDLRQAAVDGLEYFQRMFVRDIQRAFDFAVGGLADRDPGDGGCKCEQRQRKGQRSDHHPLQQSQRITLRGLHVRSGSAPSLLNFEPGTKRLVAGTRGCNPPACPHRGRGKNPLKHWVPRRPGRSGRGSQHE